MFDRSLLDLGAILLLILVNAFFAASEIALVSVRKTRLRELAEKRKGAAEKALELTDNPSRFLATIQIGVTVAGFFASAIGAVSAVVLVENWLKSSAIGVAAQNARLVAFVSVTLAISFLTLVLGELVPKNIAIHHSERLALLVARPIDWLSRATGPLVAVLIGATNAVLFVFRVRGRARMPGITVDEIASLVDVGEEEGIVKASEADMIHGVFELGETRVREIMVPRIDVVALPATATIDEASQLFLKSGHSRLPVYDGSLDNVVGVVNAKDLLPYFGRPHEHLRVTSFMRQAVFVPETKKIDELLKDLQRGRTHIAIAVDEYGGTAGIVTLEDIMEEVVGEIRDEYDPEEGQIEAVSPEEVIVHGSVGIDTINELLSIELEKGNFDSIGGFITNALGRIAIAGDVISLDFVDIEVLAVSGRRIRRVSVRRKAPVAPESQQSPHPQS